MRALWASVRSPVIVTALLATAVPNGIVRLVIAMVVGGVMAGAIGFLIGIPVLRLRGDYLAIVTLPSARS